MYEMVCFGCPFRPPTKAFKSRSTSQIQLPISSPAIVKQGENVALIPIDEEVKADNFSGGKQISPVVFYGSPNGVPPKRPSRLLLRLLREIRVDLTEQSTPSLSKEVWATFPRQDEAMKYGKGLKNVHVFGYQDHFNGQRRFLVSTYKEFWKRYKIMNSKFRLHYEVIQEGLPCHLYFDLEFNIKDNVDRVGDEMADLLISIILEICSQISSGKEKDGRLEKLFIKKDSSSIDSPSQLFVDIAVYSRNRCFRLALSSKTGKSFVLLPTGCFKAKDMCEEEMFMASLICNVDVDCKKLLVCKMDQQCIKTLQFDTEVNYSFGRCFDNAEESTLNDCAFDASTTYLMGKSPFPALDAFIESVAAIGNVSGCSLSILLVYLIHQGLISPSLQG
ncbi:hypothetical protein UlMin_041341 [Ulmus minor]